LKLRYQLYIFQILLLVILFIVLGFTYYSYQNQYKKDIESYIQSEVDIYKKEILSSIENATKKLKKQNRYFKSIHADTLEILKQNPNYDLEKLKKEIQSKYLSSYIDVELFLIDKTYAIYKTTYPKDLGFNLSVITEAKDFLDKTSKDEKIYISNFVSTDALDMKYKLYSYSKLKKDIFFEMGFIDTTLTNTIESFLKNNKKSSINVSLYNVSKDKKQYHYYELKKRDIEKSKEEQYKEFKIFNVDEKTDDAIINTIKSDSQIHIIDKNIHTIYAKVFDGDMFQVIGFDNIVMKLDINVSKKLVFIENMKSIFIFSLAIISILLLILFLFIQNRFTKPIENILNSLSSHRKVEDSITLSLNNELTEIANKYNKLFDTLNKEIEKNQFLLNENKQFIADTVHQIRTPLTNIMMNGDMIKLYKSDEKLSVFIDQINASINMLNNSYEDLSYITTFDTIEYQSSRLSLSGRLERRVEFFSTISKVNKKEIITNIEKSITIMMNQIELERLLDNNISNGIKYASFNRPMAINLQQKNGIVLLEFKTYGEPIKNTKKVFDKNYRENSGKRGLGLGLFMVMNICKKYDIAYDVTYEEGQNIFSYSFKI